MYLFRKISLILVVLALLLVGREIYAWPSDDVTALAANIYYEARGEPVLGQVLVAQVVLNRTKHSNWPNSVEQVIKQRKQFSWFSHYKSYSPQNREAWKTAIKIAKFTLENKDLDLSNGALYYHADYVKPSWAKKLTHVLTVGSHKFYR